MKEVKGYKCDFCHRVFGRPVDAHNHENRCMDRPEHRACKTCIHGCMEVTEKVEPEDSPFGLYGGHEIIEAWCNQFSMPIKDKPYFEDCDYNDSCYGEEGTPIPWSCNQYEHKGYSGWKPKVGD